MIVRLNYNCEFWNVVSQKYLKMIFVTHNREVKKKWEINKIYKHTIVSFEIIWDQKYFKIIFVTNNCEVKKKYEINKYINIQLWVLKYCEIKNVLKSDFVTNNCEVKKKCEINKIYKHTIVSFEKFRDQKK